MRTPEREKKSALTPSGSVPYDGSVTSACLSETAKLFKALSDETRLRVLHVLIVAGMPVCVCEITDALELPQYQVSKALSHLKTAGFVEATRKGTWVYHAIDTNAGVNRDVVKIIETRFASDAECHDARRIRERLKLRQGDTCVVGFAERKTGS